jgi:hypothetical protein
MDSIQESRLKPNGRLDLEHGQEKTLGGRHQLLELSVAPRASGQVVQQCRFFSFVEYPSRQLDEVCFESLVGSCLWVHHREVNAKSPVGDTRRLAGWDNPKSTEPDRCRGERTREPPTGLVRRVGMFLS